ncbi:hypothetical protein [Geosporobacter ferrireducens]|uniref:Uncharacterized protein n=1 Tax=Geosporobacter ferrireducens TaxID=1424294 RepID=A0A1D8GIG8_9FIRM|nr:hypothetical protein [Geosporobacter ferrireducens]AOT70687.1 hypothetical protein Gferi_14560 [Geosporobacter ferrireducens]
MEKEMNNTMGNMIKNNSKKRIEMERAYKAQQELLLGYRKDMYAGIIQLDQWMEEYATTVSNINYVVQLPYNIDDMLKYFPQYSDDLMNVLRKNPQMMKTMEQVVDISGKWAKIGGTALGAGLNVYTLVKEEESDFKKGLARLDLAGTATMLVGPTPIPFITSTVNTVGTYVYDEILEDKGRRVLDQMFKEDHYTKSSDERISADSWVKAPDIPERPKVFNNDKFIAALEKNYSKMDKQNSKHEKARYLEKMAQEGKPMETLPQLIHRKTNELTKKQIETIEQKRSQPGALILGNRIDTKNNRRPNLQSGKDDSSIFKLYNPQSTGQNKVKTMSLKDQGHKESALQQKNNSVNNNSFVVNIAGMNKTTNEIINELVPQLKLSLANTAGAAV